MTTITKDENILGGEPHIEGRRISVRQIVQLADQDYSHGVIAEELSLNEYEVKAALEYYDVHKSEIQRNMDEEQDLIEKAFG